jgi:HEPN domain-containing protein
MKPITAEWIAKAERDWISAQREARARKDPNYDLSCFSAQQCAEKYLKARLVEAGISFKKTHNLRQLLQLVTPVEPSWQALYNELAVLSTFAVDYRYPGINAAKATARDAIRKCRKVRKLIRQSFGLPI